MIKTYPDRAAHDAAAKSEMESTVALIENINKVVIDGVNVVTTQPKVGDIVCYDENRRLRFIELDSYREGTLPAAWETAGLVVIREGDAVTVMSKELKLLPWCPICLYLVSGFTLDGEEHVTTVKRNSDTVTDIAYSGTTLSEVAEDLKAGFAAVAEEFPFDLVFAVEDAAVRITDYSGLSRNSLSFSGLTTRTPIREMSLYDKRGYPGLAVVADGYVTSGVPNVAAAVDYFKEDINNSRYNPSADMTRYGDYPICWPAFAGTSQYQSDHCLWLRQRYCADPAHPKVEEWEEYIDDLVPKSPWMTGAFAPRYRDGAVFSAALKDVTYQAKDGSRKPLYPAVNTASELLDGGYIPTQYEFYEMFRNVTYGLSDITSTTADTINRSLHAIGGNEINVRNNFVLLGRFTTFQVFNASSTGAFHLYGSPYSSTYLILAVKSLDLSRLNE